MTSSDLYPPTFPTFLTALPWPRLHTFGAILLAILAITLVAILLDLRDGVATARRCGQKIHSHKFRVTVAKVIEYWQFIFLGFLADCVASFLDFYALPYATILFGLGVVLIEGKSMLEHARRRKSGAAKLPSAVQDIADFIGSADELRSLLTDLARRHADRAQTTDGTEAEAPMPQGGV